MSDDVRLAQLRTLLVRLERTLPSARRDWMIDEVRARVVDGETGVKPARMRSVPTAGGEAETLAVPERSRSRPEKAGPLRKPRSRQVSQPMVARGASSPRDAATPTAQAEPAATR